ncbi:MAG: hypothetical protein HQL18_04335, partial [Candidatus Omnitrophica bacterium]|nr:hypothetical protein [Candidatus Omnitrophota bacterium]
MNFIGALAVFFLLIFSPLASGQETALPSAPVAAKLDVLDLRDMDIKDALKFIAQRSGLNIVAGDSVQGRVTVYLEKVDAREALATILEANHLAYEERAGLIRVIPDEEYKNRYGYSFSQKTRSKLIALKGIKAGNAAGLLEKIKNPFGKVVADDVSG